MSESFCAIAETWSHALEGDVTGERACEVIAAFLDGEENFSELCERFGISRKQGYEWRERYEGGGIEALRDRSRAPASHPHAVPSSCVDEEYIGLEPIDDGC